MSISSISPTTAHAKQQHENEASMQTRLHWLDGGKEVLQHGVHGVHWIIITDQN